MRQPKVKVNLTVKCTGLANVYTTGDTIEGYATITVNRDTPFDEIDIIFEGTATHEVLIQVAYFLGILQTEVERVACPGCSGSKRRFFKVRQPIDATEYPSPRVLSPGHTYHFPFSFVVPALLLTIVCNHPQAVSDVKFYHTLLPPTLHDPLFGKDDMAPEGSQIFYRIRASVHGTSSRAIKTDLLAESVQNVRILPKTMGLAIRRGFKRKTAGQLRAVLWKPEPIQLLPSKTGEFEALGTVATINLIFRPARDELPPHLNTITSKLSVGKFCSLAPLGKLPSLLDTTDFTRVGRSLSIVEVRLSSLRLAPIRWERCISSANSVCDGRTYPVLPCQQDALLQESRDQMKPVLSNVCYKATVIVPVNLPKSKAWIPTFHSLLLIPHICPAYWDIIQMEHAMSTLDLSIPIQLNGCPVSDQPPLPPPESLNIEEKHN
ncbi:hypothetical protein N7532_002369 [Penicillium argentinense]|uniref:Arrestin-like N-terminal domain-containing protein n=1 Tax=Penicillium argentinense TaxID=1131581 RepID=A0A9W9KK75_9EURO|nr:uncharacterized protein N7532_002369 [Penicillium argentinense]KAJ5109724.1 hypothetical protein N7532_002369 [Penicillium argentinense]